MFKSRPPLPDFSAALREPSFYKYGALSSLNLSGDITALAHDPVLSLLALGTNLGTVSVYGAEGFRFMLPVTLESRQRLSMSGTRPRASSLATGSRPRSSSSASGARAPRSVSGAWNAPSASASARAAPSPPPPGPGIKFVIFHPGSKLIVIDDHNTLYQYDLTTTTEPALRTEPPLPVREAAASLGDVRAVETSPAHSWVFLGMADGTLRAWDAKLAKLADWRVPNLWEGHEERLRRSGVERPKTKT